jgi:hypothetical protein
MSTTAQIVEFLLSGVDVNGNVLTTGKVFFYEAGPTATLKPVYLDRNKTVEAANPYDLDANGTAQLYADGIYRIVIKNTNGSIKPALWTTVYDWDGLRFSEVAPGIGAVIDGSGYASLNAAISAIGSTPATLDIYANLPMTTDVVIPATLDVKVWGSGSITGEGGITLYSTLTIDGLVRLKKPIILRTDAHLVVEGKLEAATGFTGSSMVVVTEGSTSTPAWYSRISGGGTVDGVNKVDTGIEVYYGRQTDISHIKITGVNKYGILSGNAATDSASTGTNVDHVEIWFHEQYTPQLINGSYANGSSSVGIYHLRCTDSIVSHNQVVGFRKGFVAAIDSGSTQYSHNHAWGRRAHGPMVTGFEALSSGCTFTGDYADTPHNWYSADGSTYAQDGTITAVYGFAIRRFSQAMLNCKIYLNSSDAPIFGATNNLLTAVWFDPAISPTGYYGWVHGLSATGGTASYKYAAVYGGATGNASLQGLNADSALVVDTSSLLQQTSAYLPLTMKSATTFDAATTFNGVNVFNGAVTANSIVNIKGNAGTARNFYIKTGDTDRWVFRGDSDAESGSNAGTSLIINAYADNGAYLSTPLRINRSTGAVTLTQSLSLSAVTAASVGNDSIFRDSADNIIKIKDNAGVVHTLY